MEIAGLTTMLETGGSESLWAAHLPAFRAFGAVQTQWRTRLVATEHGLRSLVIGLDYAGAKVALDALAIVLQPHQWTDLGVLEREAAAALNGVPA